MKNLANIITLTRIFFVFIVIALLYIFNSQTAYILALVLTAILMWFDGLDGYVARKFNISTKLGALLDIMGDRIVENVFWVVFATLGWVNVAIPVIVLTRGIITDSLRTLAFEKGYTAFGKTTMMQGKIAKFIVASNFCRFTYAVCKAVAFFFLILGHMPIAFIAQPSVLKIGEICAIVSAAFCVLRGLPVVFESRRFFEDNDNK